MQLKQLLKIQLPEKSIILNILICDSKWKYMIFQEPKPWNLCKLKSKSEDKLRNESAHMYLSEHKMFV